MPHSNTKTNIQYTSRDAQFVTIGIPLVVWKCYPLRGPVYWQCEFQRTS